MDFSHVSRTTFNVDFDRRCFDMDQEICSGIHKTCLGCGAIFFIKNPDWGTILPLLSCTPEQLDRISSDNAHEKAKRERIIYILRSNESDADKKIELAGICLECCKEKEMAIQAGCSSVASYYLTYPPVAKLYKARELITLQERVAVDLYPYYLSAFKQPKLTNLDFSSKKYFGFRTALNLHLYKQKSG